MPVPGQQRVIYKSNPLREVICQLRFPKQLEIESDVPAKFQNCLSAQYPVLQIRNVAVFQVGGVDSQSKASSSQHFDFTSEDEIWKVVLNSEFIALITTQYSQWDVFKERLIKTMEAFFECYRVPFFTRTGLRYVDRVSRDKLKINDPWSELIAPPFIGVLGKDGLRSDEVSAYYSSFTWLLSEKVKSTVQYGLNQSESGETEFFFDADYFSEERIKAASDAAITTLEGFRPKTYDLFRWSITDKLHNAMEPRGV